MMGQVHLSISLLLSLLQLASASYPSATYELVKDYGAGTSAFFNNFNFFTGADPTDGNVKYYIVPNKLLTFSYLSKSAATSEGIIYNYGGVSYFGVDYWDIEANRDSVRLQSKASYSEVLIIAQFDYAPGS
jgi:hypothetical protein